MTHAALWSAGIFIACLPLMIVFIVIRDSLEHGKFRDFVVIILCGLIVTTTCEGLLTVFLFGLALMRMGK